LPELTIPCPACRGRRFNTGTLEVRFKGQSIADVLEMRVAAARDFLLAAVAQRRRLPVDDPLGAEPPNPT
jgi:excinuclease ABC subunit A